jgi:LuxR family transcriptional regulator, maltose regulon positive regulatory protein
MIRAGEDGIGGVAVPRTSAPPVQAPPSRQVPETGVDLIESLTWREVEVLQLLDARLSNKEIAASLGVASGTVQRHTRTICRKLMIGTRRAAGART